jgi:hypothetical protein
MVSQFAAAMNASAITWNGAVSLSTPDVSGEVSGRLSLLFKSVRGLTVPILYNLMEKAASENVEDAFVLAFHIRDCREGKGERELGRKAFVWLFINYPTEFERIYTLIPEYGRWDDMLQFFPKILDLENPEFVSTSASKLIVLRSLQTSIVAEFARQLNEDITCMNEGGSVTLAAKWGPTEGDAFDRRFGLVSTLASQMNLHPSKYRKTVNTPLRAYINIVEKLMCDNRWEDIDFGKVPSCAIKRLKKAFEKHEPIRFAEWKSKLSTGETKVNASVLFPYELIRELEKKGFNDEVSEAQWKIIEKNVKDMGSLADTLAVVDVSGSMAGLPMHISISIGLLVCAASEGEFKNNLITFHENPSFAVIKPGSLFEMYTQVARMRWGGSTNLSATFDMILNRAVAAKLPQEAMPKKIMIISDMQFDQATRFGTNYETIKHKYSDAGYDMPQIVFWNVIGSSNDFPVSVNDNGTALISGASPSVMRQVLDGGDFSPASILYDLTHSGRYNKVRAALLDTVW